MKGQSDEVMEQEDLTDVMLWSGIGADYLALARARGGRVCSGRDVSGLDLRTTINIYARRRAPSELPVAPAWVKDPTPAPVKPRPKLTERDLAAHREYQHNRWATDPEYRARQNAKRKENYRANLDRERTRQRERREKARAMKKAQQEDGDGV